MLMFWKKKKNDDAPTQRKAKIVNFAGETFYVRRLRAIPKEPRVQLEITDRYQIELPSGRILYGGRLEERKPQK